MQVTEESIKELWDERFALIEEIDHTQLRSFLVVQIKLDGGRWEHFAEVLANDAMDEFVVYNGLTLGGQDLNFGMKSWGLVTPQQFIDEMIEAIKMPVRYWQKCNPDKNASFAVLRFEGYSETFHEFSKTIFPKKPIN